VIRTDVANLRRELGNSAHDCFAVSKLHGIVIADEEAL
jgi:hypothetical protein